MDARIASAFYKLLTTTSIRNANVMIFVGLSTTDSLNNKRQLSKAN